MNIVIEYKILGELIDNKVFKCLVWLVFWFIIVGVLLVVFVGGFVWFNYFCG